MTSKLQTTKEGIFQDWTIYSKQRSDKQAIGFYLCHFVIAIFIFGFLVYALNFINGASQPTTLEGGFQQGLDMATTVGPIINVLFCMAIALSVVHAKKYSIQKELGLLVATLILAFLGGSLFGLMPVSSFTRKPVEKNNDN